MRTYLIRITLPDGTQGQHHGLYADGFDAVMDALTTFPNARRISAKRIFS